MSVATMLPRQGGGRERWLASQSVCVCGTTFAVAMDVDRAVSPVPCEVPCVSLSQLRWMWNGGQLIFVCIFIESWWLRVVGATVEAGVLLNLCISVVLCFCLRDGASTR